MSTSAYRNWQERIDSGTFTKAQCGQFARAVFRLAEGEEARGFRTTLTADEAQRLVAALKARGGVRLTQEHTEQGLSWITKYGAKVVGLPSEAVDGFSHFLFVGNAVIDRYMTAPIWRIVLKDGRCIDYWTTAWQAGNDNGWSWTRDSRHAEREESNR